jgi:hypothetical protein
MLDMLSVYPGELGKSQLYTRAVYDKAPLSQVIMYQLGHLVHQRLSAHGTAPREEPILATAATRRRQTGQASGPQPSAVAICVLIEDRRRSRSVIGIAAG